MPLITAEQTVSIFTEPTKDVQTVIQYLARSERWLSEKPYFVNFTLPKGTDAEQTNQTFLAQKVRVQDARGKEFDIDRHGFTFTQHISAMSRKDFEDPVKIETVYMPELEKFVKASLDGVKEVVVMDYRVRKRAPEFPTSKIAEYAYAQPLLLAHTDATHEGAKLRLARVDSAPASIERDFEVINIWRLLEGPNPDWPLALCDFQTINQEEDIVSNDQVWPSHLDENYLLHPSTNHRWYYMSDLTADEVIVFRNASSGGFERDPIAFHAAFENPVPAGQKARVRESIEVRLAVFRN